MTRKIVHRSSITGRFVGPRRVRRFPATTVTETVDVPSRRCSRRRRAARSGRFKAGKDI